LCGTGILPVNDGLEGFPRAFESVPQHCIWQRWGMQNGEWRIENGELRMGLVLPSFVHLAAGAWGPSA
jgi:hypothetical protein